MSIERTHFRRQSASRAINGPMIRIRKQQGIALITCLLLLVLMSILGLGMVVSVNSDMLINGYYGNYRSAYYAADSGLNIARQDLMNQTSLIVNQTACASWGATSPAGCTSPPVNTAGATTAINTILTNWGSTFHALQTTNSWPGSFQLPNSASCPDTFALTNTTADGAGGYIFQFQYTICVLGRGAGTQQVTTTETGQVLLQVDPGKTAGGSTTTTTSFASFGAFISNFNANSSPLVSGTITGPQFTNGSWNFGTGGSYIFTDNVSQHGPTVSYDFPASRGGGYTYIDSAQPSATYNGQTIKPTFQQGLNVGVTAAPLPDDDYSQKWAVLDGAGCGEGSNVCGNSSSPDPPSVTSANLNTYLADINGTAYNKNGATSGVYLPYSGSTLTGGGIYVEGDATSIVLSPGTDNKGNLTQIYTITQGSTTTTITTNITANTTTIYNGTKTTLLTGVPKSKSLGTPQTLLYVNGNLGTNSGGTYTGLSGPGQGQPAIQDGVQLTIVANNNINVVGDVLYKSEPVTLNTADTIITANDHNQVLGLFTQTGNFVLTSPYSNNNLEIDASMAAIGNNCSSSSCGLSTPTSDGINTLTIVGGRMEVNAHSVKMNQSNTYFDRRFQTRANQGFAPPWFPSTQVASTVIPPVPAAPSVGNPLATRLTWMTSPQN
jgi:Tfp pilus assembly protein PilX